mgnify:FL=1
MFRVVSFNGVFVFPCSIFNRIKIIHLILNSPIVLERKCFVLTLTIFSGTCGFEAKALVFMGWGWSLEWLYPPPKGVEREGERGRERERDIKERD